MFTAQTLKKGFTLIELMVVIAVIAILATISLFGLRSAQGSARNTQRQQIMNSARAALERYYGDRNSYPGLTSFSSVVSTLTALNYLVGTPSDPGCGGGASGFTGYFNAGGDWLPCGSGQIVTYQYSSGGSTYTMLLYKEAGGSSVFMGPQ